MLARPRNALILGLLAILGLGSPALAQELPTPPGEAAPNPLDLDANGQAFKKAAAQLIANFRARNPQANLGVIYDVAQAAITRGAPIYGSNPKACTMIYSAGIQAICESLAGPETVSPTARPFVGELQAALQRSAAASTQGQAWVLRRAFDKVAFEWSQLAPRLNVEAQAGLTMLGLGLFDESAMAFNSALACQREMLTSAAQQLPIEIRGLGIHASRLLVARGEFQGAGQLLEQTAALLPDLPTFPINPAQSINNPALYQQRLQELMQRIKDGDSNTDLLFFAAYELFQNQRREEALALNDRVLEAKPDHLGAQALAQFKPSSPRQLSIQQAIALFASVDLVEQARGLTALEAQGRWALEALQQVLRQSDGDPDLRSRCAALFKKLASPPRTRD
jgi:tetratricopeptide (TPR) repeat protein